MLNPEAKAIILCPPPKPHPDKNLKFSNWPTQQQEAPLPRCTIHKTDIASLIACLHELHGKDAPPSTENVDADNDTSAHEDTFATKEQPLLAHLTKKKPLPPGNVKQLLSPSANNSNKPAQPQEFNVNGVTYRQVNIATITYSISSCHANGHKGSLVDHGANGGIAGNDVHTIAKTDKNVDIQSIDNHRINKISNVTAKGVVNTQKGPVIAIMHQYAWEGQVYPLVCMA